MVKLLIMSNEMVDAVGIEPTTSRLRVECSQYTNCLYFIDLNGFTALPARTDARRKLFNLFSRFQDVYGRWSGFGQVSSVLRAAECWRASRYRSATTQHG